MKRSLQRIGGRYFGRVEVEEVGDVTWRLKCKRPKVNLMTATDRTKAAVVNQSFRIVRTEYDDLANEVVITVQSTA